MICKPCGTRFKNSNTSVVGMCRECFECIDMIARERGLNLDDIPERGHPLNRIINGVSLVYWRNRWRTA